MPAWECLKHDRERLEEVWCGVVVRDKGKEGRCLWHGGMGRMQHMCAQALNYREERLFFSEGNEERERGWR